MEVTIDNIDWSHSDNYIYFDLSNCYYGTSEVLDTLEEDDLDDVDTFYDHYCDYLSQYNSDNYAQEIKIDFESGECVGKAKDFDGYVLEIRWGAKSIYQPEFSSKEALKEAIEEDFYMPKTFNWKDKLIFLTGVWEG